jgi:integrase
VAGKEIKNIDGLSIVDTEYKNVGIIEIEKEKIKEAERINKYFGVKSTPETIIKEIKNREHWKERKERFEEFQKKYGDYELIADEKKVKEILVNGDFDQTDLYLYCCAITNQERNAIKFSALLHRFREYNLRNNTTLRTKDFTFEGVQKFVLFFVDNGILDFSSIGMTPFNYRTDKFIQRMNEKGTALVPTDETWRKFFIYLKLLLKLLNKDGLLKAGWDKDSVQRIDQITEVCNEENYGIEYSSLSSNTRQNYFLNKDEFDTIFKLKLKDALQTKKHPHNGHVYEVGYSKEDLTVTRDMFVCMAWLGGLRPIEYSPEKISVLKDSKGEYYVNFITSDKNKKEVANPVLNYAYDILKKYDFKIPYAKIDSLEFKKRLQAILKQAGIDREIDKIESRSGEHKKTKVNIQEAIYPYFARHTFIQILTDEGLHENQIVRYTGQAFPNVSIEAYSTKGIKVKSDWIKHIKAK